MTQEKALQILESGENVFLTGEPGAGKTYVINLFVEALHKKCLRAEVTASTGIASTHIGGVTVHSWSGIGIKEKLTNEDVNKIMHKPYVRDRISRAHILIIDEISMINAQTLDNVDKVCRAVRRLDDMTNAEKAFGGLQIIFVGDFYQLPPVTKKGPVKFAFESQAWLSAEPKICYLTEQHRQEDPKFLDILTAFRQGEIESKHRDILNNECIRKSPKEITKLFTHNKDVDYINEMELRKLKTESRDYVMTSSGNDYLVQTLKKNCLSPEELEIRIGALVMFTWNNFDAGYVNGTLGKVIGFSENTGMPLVETKEGRILEPSIAEWSIADKSARIQQVPLRLAWAITVHKCQGMSLDCASIDLSQAFEYGQGYVALSRVRSLEGLYLEGINERAYEMHPTVVKKDDMFRKLSE